MNKITVYQAHNRFFLPVPNGLSEIPFVTLNTWREQGTEIVILEVEMYV